MTDEEEIAAAVERFLRAYNAGDVETIAGYYADDLVKDRQGAPPEKKAETVARVRGVFRDFSGSLSVSNDEIVVSGDLAYARGTLRITLTPRAVEELNDLILSQDKAGSALRVWVAGGGCSGLSYGMALDDNAPEADDRVFHQDGLKVMVDELSLGYMDGAIVDYVDDVLGGGFKVENPQATGGCGCGNSFSTEGSAAGGGCGSGCGSGGCGSH